jgi:hypothetical protein
MNRRPKSSCGISLFTPGVIPEELREQFGNACELVCIQVPKVYDSCLLKLCLVGDCKEEDPDQGIVFDENLKFRIDCSATEIINARVVGLVPGSFRVISKRPTSDPDRKLVSYTYQLRVLYDVVFDDGTISEDNELLVRRSETVGPLYCPEARAIIRETKIDQTGRIRKPTDEDDEIVKLEIVARVLDATIERGKCDTPSPYDDMCFAKFTIGVYNVIKCELIVQLVVPAFGFCPPPAPCETRPGRRPCEEFNEEFPPDFFPPQLDDLISGPGL